MKKAQILGALALAFALGVVAPVASTHAAFVMTDKDGNLVTDKDATAKVNEAIKNAKNTLGYHMTGTGAAAARAWYYDQYKTLANDLDTTADNVAAAKKIVFKGGSLNGNTLTALATQYSDIIGVAKTGIGSTFAANIPETMPSTYDNYDKALSFIKTQADAIVAASVGVSAGAAEVYNTAEVALEEVIKDAKDEIKAVEDTQANTIMADISAITDENVDGLTYAQAVEAANKLSSNNGAATVAIVRNLEKAIKYAEDIRDSGENFWSSEADKAIDNINKALQNKPVTDEDVKKPNTSDNGSKAPDTGILSTEDGGASTTVAMVAGVATALTAAGAGVVAYRNARRSSRK